MFLQFYLSNMLSSLVGPGWEEATVKSQLASIDADLGRFRVTLRLESHISVGVCQCSKLRCSPLDRGSVVPDRSCTAVLHLPEVITSSSSSFSTFLTANCKQMIKSMVKDNNFSHINTTMIPD